jgi:DNA-directed RNA polymerase subunit E'/Rpb7
MKSNFKKTDIKNKFLEHDLLKQNLYVKQFVNKKVELDFSEINEFITEKFIQYAKKNIINKCNKEGYISGDYIKIISYSAGKLNQHKCVFDVVYEFNILYPHENLIIRAKIQSITKIGIKAVLSNNEKENPMVIFASRLHNANIIMNDEEDDLDEENIDNPFKHVFKEGDIIRVKIIGSRYEINDPCLYCLGEIVKDKPKIIS